MHTACARCGVSIVDKARYCWNCGEPVAAGLAGRSSGWETCEIVFTEGLIDSGSPLRCPRFSARASGPTGLYITEQSAGFYCPDWAPEPLYAIKQHEALVDTLIRQGWEATGESGPEWWRRRFRRSLREAAAHHGGLVAGESAATALRSAA